MPDQPITANVHALVQSYNALTTAEKSAFRQFIEQVAPHPAKVVVTVSGKISTVVRA